MNPIPDRREFTDRLLKRLGSGPSPAVGDFVAICTDLSRDAWELFPIAMVAAREVVSVRSELGGLLTVHSLAERNETLVSAASEFRDLAMVRQICWTPFEGLAALRVRLARLRGEP